MNVNQSKLNSYNNGILSGSELQSFRGILSSEISKLYANQMLRRIPSQKFSNINHNNSNKKILNNSNISNDDTNKNNRENNNYLMNITNSLYGKSSFSTNRDKYGSNNSSFINSNNNNSNNRIINNYKDKKLYSNDINNAIPEKKESLSKIYNRQMAQKVQSEMKLEKLRQKKINDELMELKSKPTINKKSKKISKNNPPIFKRLDQIRKNSKDKILKIQKGIQEEQKNIENNLNFYNKTKFYNKYCNNNELENENDFQNWIEQNERWESNRKQKIEKLKYDIKKYDNEEEELRFRPEINKKSDYIIRAKGTNLNDRLNLQKETREEYAKRKIDETRPSFEPKINHYYKIHDNYYDFMNVDQEEIYKNQ